MDKFETELMEHLKNIVDDLQQCFIEENDYCYTPSASEWRKARRNVHKLALSCHELFGYVRAKRTVETAFIKSNLVMLSNEQEKSDVGTSEVRKDFVEFTEKEINKMPQKYRKIFRTNKRNAHVRKHRSVYEIRIQINGYRIEVYSKYLDVAKEKFIKKLQEYESGKITARKASKQTFLLPYIEKWMNTVKKPFIKESTYKMYLQTFNAYLTPKFKDKAIESLTQIDLQTFINGFISAGKNRTAEKIALMLSAVFDYAVDDGIIPRSPMKRVVVSRYEEKHGVSLTRSEEKSLINTLQTSNDVYVQAYVFMAYTGIRRGELASLEISDEWVSVVTGKQRLGKKEQRRRLPISPMLKRYLHIIDVDTIKALSPAMLTKHIKRFLPSHHCHDLRHTFITRAQECGIKRELVSLWAGHAADSSITSNVYTHLEQNEEHQINQMRLFTYNLH